MRRTINPLSDAQTVPNSVSVNYRTTIPYHIIISKKPCKGSKSIALTPFVGKRLPAHQALSQGYLTLADRQTMRTDNAVIANHDAEFRGAGRTACCFAWTGRELVVIRNFVFLLAAFAAFVTVPQMAHASCSGNGCHLFSVENKKYSASERQTKAVVVNKDKSKVIRIEGCV